MSKVINLRAAIRAALTAVHPRVFYERAPQGETYPYLVYVLDDSQDDSPIEQFRLEVDGWDAAADTTALETLMDAVDAALHRKVSLIALQDLGFTVFRDRRFPLADDDPQLRRRKAIYNVRAIGGS